MRKYLRQIQDNPEALLFDLFLLAAAATGLYFFRLALA
jgi:hypothetical protein